MLIFLMAIGFLMAGFVGVAWAVVLYVVGNFFYGFITGDV